MGERTQAREAQRRHLDRHLASWPNQARNRCVLFLFPTVFPLTPPTRGPVRLWAGLGTSRCFQTPQLCIRWVVVSLGGYCLHFEYSEKRLVYLGKRNCQGVSVVKRDIGHYHVVGTAGLLKWKDIPTGVLKTGTFSMLAFGRLVIAEK